MNTSNASSSSSSEKTLTVSFIGGDEVVLKEFDFQTQVSLQDQLTTLTSLVNKRFALGQVKEAKAAYKLYNLLNRARTIVYGRKSLKSSLNFSSEFINYLMN